MWIGLGCFVTGCVGTLAGEARGQERAKKKENRNQKERETKRGQMVVENEQQHGDGGIIVVDEVCARVLNNVVRRFMGKYHVVEGVT